jgi:hypothetical protein
MPFRFRATTRRSRRRWAASAVLSLAAGTIGVTACSTGAPHAEETATAAHASIASPGKAAAKNASVKIRHIWIIELENESFATSFSDKKLAPYLSKTMVGEGALLRNYYGIGHDSLDNYIAEISGQAPNYQTGQDCEYFANFLQFGGENFDKWTKDGQLSGDGCVYPSYVKTIANQLTAKKLTWKAYEEDMGNNPKRDGTTKTKGGPACGHPKIGAVDLTDTTGPKDDSYATRHDPFVYFHSIIDDKGYCDRHVVTLSHLRTDLKRTSTTPNYSFITPNTCHDAHDTPLCQNGQKGGLSQANGFLKKWVPAITGSPAYKQGGLVIVLFDESGEDSQAGGCCGEVDSLGYTDPAHPNTNEPGLYGPGGGRVGAVLLSPYIKAGTVSSVGYNHYSMLRSIEGYFGLSYLGDAKEKGVTSFGRDVFTKAVSTTASNTKAGAAT